MDKRVYTIDTPGGSGAPSGRRPTQCAIVRSAIEQDIVTGVLPPGAPLDEDAIAQRFSVSRTPVREALLQLIESGLVKKSPRQPAVVAPLDVRRLIQSFEVMSELEALCARLAARRISAQERKDLSALQQEADAALARADHDAMGRLGSRFHQKIWQATHNEVLIETVSRFAIGLTPYRLFQLKSEGRPGANNEDHQALLALILGGQSDDAAALMKRHVSVQGDVLADYISMTQSFKAD
jgi:DNA-binding GntR family transcriptional regulator